MAVVLNVISTFNDKGLKSATNELDKFSKATTEKLGTTTKAMGAVGFGILAGAGAVAVGLYQIGSSFDEAFDAIRTGTGATGPALEALQNDMKAVASAVPASFADAGAAVTGFNQKLGLTGQPLQLLSEQALELSRITGTELAGNVESITNVMQNFGVSAGDQSGKLDLLFRASQASGVSVADLSSQMSGAGVVLRQVGLDFDQSAAFLATLGKAGVDAADVMPSLTRALATAAKGGKDAATMFNETFDAIKNAKDPIAAATIGMEVFGAKGGTKFAALIREGKLSYQDMLATVQGGSETILGAGADTQDFGEKLTLLKNRVFVALEPIATKVFGAIGDAMDRVGPKVEQLTNWMMEHQGVVKIVAGVLGGVMLVALAAYTAGMLVAASATIAAGAPFIAIGVAIAAVVAAIVYLWTNWDQVWNWIMEHKAIAAIIAILGGPILVPIFALVAVGKWLWANWKTIWEGIQTVVAVVWSVLQTIWGALITAVEAIWNAMQFLWDVAQNVWSGIVKAIEFAWSVIQTIWGAIQIAISILVAYYQFLWNVVQTVWSAITGAIGAAWGFISRVFDSIKGGIQSVIDWFLSIPGTIGGIGAGIAEAIGNGFKSAWNTVANFINRIIPDSVGFSALGYDVGIDLPDNPIPTFASGGYFNTSMAGGSGLAVLHDNEMILNAQQQKALFSGNGLGGGGGVYNINVNVSATADKAAIGQTIVEAISAYERRAGDGWRAA
jgi:TP901 family phage tail tape measure protein